MDVAAGGRFFAELASGAEILACPVTESLHGQRMLTGTISASKAGRWRLVVQVEQGSLKEADGQAKISTLLQADVAVAAAEVDASCSYLTGFWPRRGALAAVSAGFVIQVRLCGMQQVGLLRSLVQDLRRRSFEHAVE